MSNNNVLLNKKVLVAEDSPVNQMIVKQALLKLEVTADFAVNGAEAIEKFKNQSHDLILMDIQMPETDGYEATKYIRSELRSDVPIIGMTASNLNDEEDKCYKCGMNACLSKPFTAENLQVAMEDALLPAVAVDANPRVITSEGVSIDLNLLYDVSGNDENFVAMMVRTFLDNMPPAIQNIEHNFSEENWEGLRQSAHYTKSTLSVIKVNEMLDDVLAIEEYARTKSNLEKLPALVQKVSNSFLVAKDVLIKRFG